MALHSMTLLTVITETFARPAIDTLLRRHGLTGYTVSAVEGAGHKGERSGDLDALSNLRLEVITTDVMAERVLAELERDYFPRYAMIAYAAEVRVVRAAKFGA